MLTQLSSTTNIGGGFQREFAVDVDNIIGRGIQNMLRKFLKVIPNFSKLNLLQTYLLKDLEML
jgi:hypothetical protein